MKNNNQSNRLIKWCVIALDFVALWLLLFFVVDTIPHSDLWDDDKESVFWMVCSVSLLIAEWRFSTIIHQRVVGANDILRRATLLVLTQTLLTYLLLRAIHFNARIGWHLLAIGIGMLLIIILLRLVERWFLKHLRRQGHNTRYVTLVGSDPEMQRLYGKLLHNPTLGYKVRSCYGNNLSVRYKGSVDDFAALLNKPDNLRLGDELYLCVSHLERSLIERTVQLCNQRMVKFYYIPPANESFNLQPLFIDDIEVQTTYTSPLEDLLNRIMKRFFDISLATVALLLTALLLPVIFILVKIQSPGPLFFRQLRTGLDGHEFLCYKFRSMQVNADSDSVQATKDDPRIFPFGHLMRKTNIDELPQFWNVLRGDMSVVGPRPHMLAHTEQYSQLISKYMVRHFIKPGITGWAQVTGFRGETSELWQMEGRVERDIWYMQHWSPWLDIRIVWMTFKAFFKKDRNAY